MSLLEAVRTAFESLRAHKLRSFLTALGILIGVAAVIAIVAVTSGLDRFISDEILRLGSGAFSINKLGLTFSGEEWERMWRRKNLTLDELEYVRASCAECREVGATLYAQRTVTYRSLKQENVGIVGVTENINRIGTAWNLMAGRHLVRDDLERAHAVAVIGGDLREAFFSQVEPLGKSLSVAGEPVRVVGVVESQGASGGESRNNWLWIPITTFRKLFGRRDSISIAVEARSLEAFERAQEQCRVALRVRRRLRPTEPDDFTIETGESLMNLWRKISRGVYAVMLSLTAISLLIGGIVVMNIMLVTVTERVREIGVRRAVGARRRDIRRQFLVEALALSLLGGLLGILGAMLFSLVLSRVLGGILYLHFTAPVRPWAVVLAVLFSAAVGLTAGIYPATRAAALDPIDALRNE